MNSQTILHISTADNTGGSARSARSIHDGLKRLGWRSRMLVANQTTTDEEVGPIWRWPAGRLLDRLCGEMTNRLSLQDVFYPSSFLLSRHPWFREADIVQLYNLHGGYFSFTALARLSRRRPIVWRLSDMWPLTGHCVYSYACERWKTGCGACPILSDYPALRRDTTALLWRLKQRVYANSSLTLVAPSRWMAGLAEQSPLLNRFPIHVIPNGLDTNVFRPIPKATARERLGLERETRLALFMVQRTTERRKGAAQLIEALTRLTANPSCPLTVLVAGSGASEWAPDATCPVKRFHHLDDVEQLATLYSAADVFVLPSLADHLPNSLLESMACGTPAVTFGVGGIPEAARHLETAYVATDLDDFARGIRLLLDQEALRSELGRNARRVAEQEFSLPLQAERFATLYQDILSSERRSVAERESADGD